MPLVAQEHRPVEGALRVTAAPRRKASKGVVTARVLKKLPARAGEIWIAPGLLAAVTVVDRPH